MIAANNTEDPLQFDATETSRLIPLNLIYDYPVNWTQFKVLRDFIQNFYDSLGWQNWEARFSSTLHNGQLRLVAKDIHFSYDWLLHIGASTKREEPSRYAGYFGEGFKIASLCALRDYNWQVAMQSRDWELEVTTTTLRVDNRALTSLAYQVRRLNAPCRDTVLTITPFDDHHLLKTVLLSFYYPENPLFGEPIWVGADAAIHFRSAAEKPRGYPSTYDNSGPGIIFAAYQALGSFHYPLIVSLHTFRMNDRERSNFFSMDVVKIIEKTVSMLPPSAAFAILPILRRNWYSQPRKKYDFESWHGIVGKLVRIVADSGELAQRWRERYPDLLVAHPVKRKNIADYNRRRQALAWLRHAPGKKRLVQRAFTALGYPTLEEACEADDGFSITRPPTPREQPYIDLLEELVQILLPNAKKLIELPPCRVIKRTAAVWQGMTSCLPIKGAEIYFLNQLVRYRLSYIALREELLWPHDFGNALSTWLHELAHIFGGDRSASFSRALSELMQIILDKAQIIAEYQKRWEQLEK